MAKIDHSLLKTITEVAKWMDGVAPRLALRDLEAVFTDPRAVRRGVVLIAGTPYPTALWGELSVLDECRENPRVTPAGARFLLDLYERDVLPMKPKLVTKSGKFQKRVDPAMHAFIQSEAEMTAKAAMEARFKDKEYVAMLDNLADIPEHKFSHTLLSDIFMRRMGQWSGSITVGGYQVIKSIIRDHGDGKVAGVKVRFTWRSQGGVMKAIEEGGEFLVDAEPAANAAAFAHAGKGRR